MQISLLVCAVLVSAHADEISKPAPPASSLERALADDWRPACQIGGKSYAMERDDEGACTDRGGKVTIGPRKKLNKLSESVLKYHPLIRPNYNEDRTKSPSLNPYDHKDPLGK